MLYLGPDMMKIEDEKELYGMDYWAVSAVPSKDKRL